MYPLSHQLWFICFLCFSWPKKSSSWLAMTLCCPQANLLFFSLALQSSSRVSVVFRFPRHKAARQLQNRVNEEKSVGEEPKKDFHVKTLHPSLRGNIPPHPLSLSYIFYHLLEILRKLPHVIKKQLRLLYKLLKLSSVIYFIITSLTFFFFVSHFFSKFSYLFCGLKQNGGKDNI